MTRLLNALVACLLLAAMPAWAATSTVASADALWTAAHAKTVQPGDTITVTAASGPLDLSNIAVTAPGLTIQAAPGVVVDRITVGNSQGLTVRGFEVAGTPSWMADVQAGTCSRIVFDRMKVHSADGTISGSGFQFRNCTDSAVTNSSFDHVGQGGALIDSDRIVVQGNSFSNIESDGLDVANTSHARVIGNRFTDFFPVAGDHPDGIQFFAVGKAPADYPTGSLVEDNIILRGKGLGADGKPFPEQGIFVESQDHLTIHRNAISCSLYNAISLSGVNTALIDNNYVSGCADFGGNIITRGGSDHVTVSNNAAPGLPVTYAGVGEGPVTNYVDGGGNRAVPWVPVPAAGQSPDTAALDAWIAANIGAVTPAPVPTPIPVPTPSPAPDPRDAQIAAFTAQVANLNATVASLTQAANDNAAKLAAAQTAASAAQSAAQAAATQLAAVNAQLTAAKAQASALQASDAARKKALTGIASTATAAAK